MDIIVRRKTDWTPYVFLIAPLALYTIFMIFPTVYSFYISLHNWDGLSGVREFIGLDNYVEVLTEDEIVRIGNYVPEAFRSVPILVIAENDSVPAGFMGIDGNMLEMLFIDPDSRGKGTGRKLIERGIREYGVRKTTVNEQNPQAVGFYRHMGFIETDRSDTDSDGRPYPILTMELKEGR